MSRNTFENQSMLVVIGVGGIGYGIIAATASDVIKHEVKEVSGMVEDHFGEDAPTEFGLYVWEGTLTVETGGWAGDVIDPDTWWEGAFRKATQADLVGFGFLESAPDFEAWWKTKAIEHNGRDIVSRYQEAKEAWAAALTSVTTQTSARAPSGKRPDAIPTSQVPELRLQCYHLSVTTVGKAPHDSVKGHSGHNFIELVDPEPDTSQLLQAWANECWDNRDEGPVMRHLIITDRHGERRFIAQRMGNTIAALGGCIKFDTYTDYAGVLPNPGVEEMSAEFDVRNIRPSQAA